MRPCVHQEQPSKGKDVRFVASQGLASKTLWKKTHIKVEHQEGRCQREERSRVVGRKAVSHGSHCVLSNPVTDITATITNGGMKDVCGSIRHLVGVDQICTAAAHGRIQCPKLFNDDTVYLASGHSVELL